MVLLRYFPVQLLLRVKFNFTYSDCKVACCVRDHCDEIRRYQLLLDGSMLGEFAANDSLGVNRARIPRLRFERIPRGEIESLNWIKNVPLDAERGSI